MLGEVAGDKARFDRRYPIVAEVFCCWTSHDNHFEFTQGITRDVSLTGAYVLGDRSPEIGTHVQFNILWPDLGFTNPSGHLAGTGTVLRVDAFRDAISSRRVGFAFSLQFHPVPDQSLFDRWAHFLNAASSSHSLPSEPWPPRRMG